MPRVSLFASALVLLSDGCFGASYTTEPYCHFDGDGEVTIYSVEVPRGEKPKEKKSGCCSCFGFLSKKRAPSPSDNEAGSREESPLIEKRQKRSASRSSHVRFIDSEWQERASSHSIQQGVCGLGQVAGVPAIENPVTPEVLQQHLREEGASSSRWIPVPFVDERRSGDIPPSYSIQQAAKLQSQLTSAAAVGRVLETERAPFAQISKERKRNTRQIVAELEEKHTNEIRQLRAKLEKLEGLYQEQKLEIQQLRGEMLRLYEQPITVERPEPLRLETLESPKEDGVDLNDIQERLSSVEGQLVQLASQPVTPTGEGDAIEVLQERLSSVEGQLVQLASQPVTPTGEGVAIEALQERLSSVEGQLSEFISQLATPTGEGIAIEVLQERLSSVEGQFVQLTSEPVTTTGEGSEIEALQSTVAELQGAVEGKADVTRLGELRGALDAAIGRIDAVHADVGKTKQAARIIIQTVRELIGLINEWKGEMPQQ